MYIYIYTYVHMYVYIYIYTCIGIYDYTWYIVCVMMILIVSFVMIIAYLYNIWFDALALLFVSPPCCHDCEQLPEYCFVGWLLIESCLLTGELRVLMFSHYVGSILTIEYCSLLLLDEHALRSLAVICGSLYYKLKALYPSVHSSTWQHARRFRKTHNM